MSGECDPAWVMLHAGPLSACFDTETGWLRSISWRQGTLRAEVLLGIYSAVRDHDWDTYPVSIRKLQVDRGEEEFRLTFEALCEDGVGRFRWNGIIVGDARGHLRFEMDGEVEAEFRRNRIGFCVLHPASCAGRGCEIEFADGDVASESFPLHISPHQPFKNLRSISHEIFPGLRSRVRFEGEVFEMEDQRNWTDASFKTYCTPLDLPFPVAVKKGDRIIQAISVDIGDSLNIGRTVDIGGSPDDAGKTPEVNALDAGKGDPRSIEVRLGEVRGVMPAIGLVLSQEMPALAKDLRRLQNLSLDHLRVDLHGLSAGMDWKEDLARAGSLVEELNVGLHVAVRLSGRFAEELDELQDALRDLSNPPKAFLLLDEGRKIPVGFDVVQKARNVLANSFRDASLIVGTDAYFTELNRNRPELEGVDAICYSINPQVHAFDDSSLIESLPMQATTVESARQFCGDLPIVVSPVTLLPRYNPDATGPAPDPKPGDLPANVDPRQRSLFAAGWTLGSLRHLASAAVQSVTYFETIGWRGVMESASGARKSDAFPSQAGEIFPLYHVLADVGEFAGAEVIEVSNSHPGDCEVLVLRRQGALRILMANMREGPVAVKIDGLQQRSVTSRQLDDDRIDFAMHSPEQFREQHEAVEFLGNGAVAVKLAGRAVSCLDVEEASNG